jgi:3-phenylpropionate/trans-cinnamate dioxygenase ferredoxin component
MSHTSQTTSAREVRVGRVEDIPEGEVAVVQLDVRVAVFHAEGEFFAVDDRCTHQEAYLSDGFVEGCWIECPLHASQFDLRTGRPSAPPATVPVRTHRVVVRQGEVFILQELDG